VDTRQLSRRHAPSRLNHASIAGRGCAGTLISRAPLWRLGKMMTWFGLNIGVWGDGDNE
jgi:hypothetical protein